MSSKRLLLVDDSAFFLQVFTRELSKHLSATLDVAHSVSVAMTKLHQHSYSAVVLDIMMPETDGLSAVRQIRKQFPHTTLFLMSAAKPDALQRMGFETAVLDAVEFIPKPSSREDMKRVATQLRQETVQEPFAVSVVETTQSVPKLSVIGMVVSTGGPNTLVSILERLPADYPIPILIVQHMSAGFLSSFVHWLDGRIPITVNVVAQSQLLKPGVWIAPENAHLMVKGQRMILDSISPPYKQFKPSGTHLLTSIGEAHQSNSMGVVLTGLGSDGAEGLRTLVECGGTSVVQDSNTCVISGMVDSAKRQTTVAYELSPEKISELLLERGALSQPR